MKLAIKENGSVNSPANMAKRLEFVPRRVPVKAFRESDKIASLAGGSVKSTVPLTTLPMRETLRRVSGSHRVVQAF